MQQFSGKAVSPGYASGTAYVYQQFPVAEIPRSVIAAENVAREQTRFREALERAFRELKDLERRVSVDLGESQSAIFAAHLGLLKDANFSRRIETRIQREFVNAEQAVDLEVAELCRLLASVKSAYISERAQDIRDVGRRVLRQLAARETGHYVELPPRSVIVARELLPSETLDLDRKHVVGIITEVGGENSHSAILARALGIPAVTGIAAATSAIPTGAPVLMDGERGIVSVKPSDAALADYKSHKSHYDDGTTAAVAAECLDCKTVDGTRISLLANLNRSHEARQVMAHHLDGVGLYRTEFMFLDSTEPPSFERQVTAYRQLIENCAKDPIVIRTLDFGGDKLPAFLVSHHEANPMLGLRGLRFSLVEQTLFETQIRAIVTAAQGRRGIRVLLPMVLGADDLAEAVDLVRTLAEELGATPPKIGAMIETPAALFALDEIFDLADFVCIGTNDLTQFMLAADRNAFELVDDYSALHPSVLRALKSVFQAGNAAGREVCVCGEAASYPRSACLLVGLGARQLSMSPIRAARVRFLLRQMRLAPMEELARGALDCRSTAEVRALLQHFPREIETGRQAVTS